MHLSVPLAPAVLSYVPFGAARVSPLSYVAFGALAKTSKWCIAKGMPFGRYAAKQN